jgi:hypothetical protein
VPFSVFASNSGSGTGTFVPGAATFQLQLIQSDGVNPQVVLDTKTVAVTLIANTPQIFSIDMPLTNWFISTTAPVNYTATFSNPGPALTEVIAQAYVSQDQGNGVIVTHAGGGAQLTCPSQPMAVLPPGLCTISLTTFAENSGQTGSGQFIEGPATFILELHQGFTSPVVLDRKTIAINLSFPIQ